MLRDARPRTWAPEPGTKLAQYELVKKLGEGSMGVVFLARDTVGERPVALKIIHPDVAQDPDRRRRFVREARISTAIQGPGIGRVFEVAEADEQIFLAMEFIDGKTLGDLLEGGRRLSVGESVRVVRDAAAALSCAHAAAVVHRDLKPDNLMIARDGRVLVVDFGLAKSHDAAQVSDSSEALTRSGVVVGTPEYMSPEQAKGRDTDGRSDVFSLGVVFYQLLTGKKPFDGETWQDVIIAISNAPHVSATQLGAPAELGRIVDRCLEKEPSRRYQSCNELVRDLDRWSQREGSAPPPRLSSPGLAVDDDPLAQTAMVAPAAAPTTRDLSRARTLPIHDDPSLPSTHPLPTAPSPLPTGGGAAPSSSRESASGASSLPATVGMLPVAPLAITSVPQTLSSTPPPVEPRRALEPSRAALTVRRPRAPGRAIVPVMLGVGAFLVTLVVLFFALGRS
jgi:serine/threonine protein kinase